MLHMKAWLNTADNLATTFVSSHIIFFVSSHTKV